MFFQYLGVALVMLFALGLSACDSSSSSVTSSYSAPASLSVMEQIEQSGELVVLIRNAPTVYYYDREGKTAGFEHDLMAEFAAGLGLTVRYVELDGVDDILAMLKSGEGHVAAAGLTAVQERNSYLLNSDAYHEVQQQVVCRRGGDIPKNIEALQEVGLTIISDSSYVAQLTTLQQSFPELSWQTVEDVDTEELLGQVWRKEISCTVADSTIVDVNRRYHPELVVAFNLTEPEPLVWYLVDEGEELLAAINDWLATYRASGELAVVAERYYGYIDTYDYVDNRKYLNRLKQRLPKYREMFEEAAEQYGIPWTLLAAQSYQESHWDSKATSPTGVRGMMMLTRVTAGEVGVDDRLDARQSIFGGAEYLNKLRKRLPEELAEPDRTWFALAAYNVGMGHMWDARALARQLGKDPNSWADIKTVLPLLTQKRYYKSLKYGYARGHEPVRYVARIRDFEDVLIQQQL